MCIRDRFITVQTKSGNTFFIVIDYDAPINEDEEQYQTYFLNMVDESDLLALLDEDTAAALTTCNCKEKCAAGQVNTCLLYTSHGHMDVLQVVFQGGCGDLSRDTHV